MALVIFRLAAPASLNYKQGRALPVGAIVLHHMAGTLAGAIARFADPTQQASAHLAVTHETPARIGVWVDDQDTAFHAGSWPWNSLSIGVETEDMGHDDYTESQYEALATIVRDKCHQYLIPLDRGHVKGHREVSESPTSCPGGLDVDRIVARARALAGSVIVL